MDITLGICVVLLSALHLTEGQMNLGELGCLDVLLPNECPVGENCMGHCKDACSKSANLIFGTGIYPSFSPICKSAAHDLRIPVWNSSGYTFYLKRTVRTNFTFYGSFRYRIMSLSKRVTSQVSSYEFISPPVSENTVDILSIHKSYLFGEDENHIQECFISPKWVNLEFYTYDGKNDGMKVVNHTDFDDFKSVKVVWSVPKKENSRPNAGFQCVPTNNTLSTLTSLAFRKDAYFLSSFLTLTVNKNENVTLNMFEAKPNKRETIWSKDGVMLEKLYIVPQHANRTSITLTNTEGGFSGIYSLEYKDYNLQRRGYVRLIVRACPKGKYGLICNQDCPECLNGGVCHDVTGNCVCAPGFKGLHCEEACEVGFVGGKCSVQCNRDLDTNSRSCKGLLICLPDPYGCSCAAGYSGTFCSETCQPGTYGAGCNQMRDCYCAHGKGCDIYSGECKGECEEGWYGKYCNETPIEVIGLSYNIIPPAAVNLTWEVDSYGPSSGVKHYKVTYKQIKLRTACDISAPKMIKEIKVTKTWILLDDLIPFSVNLMSVSAVTSIVGPPIEITVETPATAPPPPSDFHVSYQTTSSLYLSWIDPVPPNGVIESYEISYRQSENSSFIKIGTKTSKTSCQPHHIFVNQQLLRRNCFAMRNLKRNQKYQIQLKAFNANVNENSEPLIIEATTHAKEPEADIHISVIEQTDRRATVFVYKQNPFFSPESASTNMKYFLVVDSTEKSHAAPDFDEYINFKSPCVHRNPNTYITGVLHIIPIYGINFTIGNGSCLEGYYNLPLKTTETYKFGLLSVFSDCKDTIYGPIVFTDKVTMKRKTKPTAAGLSFSDKAFRIVLGLLIPFTIILFIGALYSYLPKPKSFDTLIPKRRFFFTKDKNDFAANNDGLDDFDIVETESISEDISNCMPVKELPDYVKHNGKNNKIRKEFMSVPKGQLYPCSAAKLVENKNKNRYGNILAYDHNRVILKENGDSDYIHANYVDGYKKPRKYIATQGPMNLTIQDFWSMIWQEKVSKIIMITNLEENGKIKCEKYWSDEVTTYGSIDLSLKCSENYADYLIRTFSLSKDNKNREVKQFHFTSWPDHGIPVNTTPFLNFLKKVDVNANCDEPILVHCSAGIGRTGAVILFENSFDMGVQEGKVDILGQLCSMRKQRMNIVETYEQYIFILHALVESLCIEKTSVNPITFLKEYNKILGSNSDAGIITIEKQFQMLKDLPLPPLYTDILAAYAANNLQKNRSMHILPYERSRPILKEQTHYTDYINAVYIDGYRSKNKFVATQYPLPETVTDFWRMVYELDSKIIVILQDIPLSDSKNPELWPSYGVQVFDMLEVEFDSVEEEKDVLISNLIVKHKAMMKELPVKVIQVKHWAVDKDLPPDTSALLSVMKWLQQGEDTDSTITTVCLDGVTACGVFCSFLYILDRMKSEKEIDIFQTAKCIRANRPQFITNMDQYRFLFALTKSYLESDEHYLESMDIFNVKPKSHTVF